MPDFEPYLRGWRERWARERELGPRLAADARRVAERVAGLLVERYGARRVVLGGSLARGEFARDSDIDLAVEGLPRGRFWEADADAAAQVEPFRLDLVPIEGAAPAYLRHLAEEGVVLRDSRRQ